MRTEEFLIMEREALESARGLATLCAEGDCIAFVMSRDVYMACLNAPVSRSGVHRICSADDYDDNGVQTGTHSVYFGYDLYVINEDVHAVFQPAVKGFGLSGFRYDRLSRVDFVLSESAPEGVCTLHRALGHDATHYRMTVTSLFEETGLTACMQRDVKEKTRLKTPEKDWDERIAPEDTRDLDEFLNSLVRKNAQEPLK